MLRSEGLQSPEQATMSRTSGRHCPEHCPVFCLYFCLFEDTGPHLIRSGSGKPKKVRFANFRGRSKFLTRETIHILHIFASGGPNYKMRKIRPTCLILTGIRCNGNTENRANALGQRRKPSWGRTTYQRTHPPENFWTPPRELLVWSVISSLQG